MRSDNKIKEPKTKKRRAVRSALGGVWDETNRKIYRFVRDGMVGRYMSGYDKTCEKFRSSSLFRLVSFWRKKHRAYNDRVRFEKLPEGMEGVAICEKDSGPVSLRDRFSKGFDSSWIVNFLRWCKDLFLYTPLVSYGVLLFSFALFMLISQTVTLFFSMNGIASVFPWQMGQDTVLIATFMVVAVVLMTVSIVLIFAKEGSLYSFLTESVISGFLLKHMAGITSSSVRQKERVRHNGRAFVFGMILGLVTFFVQPAELLGALGLLLYSVVVVSIPEFGLVSIIFMLPFLTWAEHPTLATVAMAIVVLISTLIKLMRRKRSVIIEPADVFVLLFLVLILFGGIFTTGGKDSFFSALVMLVLGFVYFVVTILIKDDEWLKRCLNSFMISSCIVSLSGILEWILGNESNTWQDNSVFSSISGRVVSLWENPNVLAEFLTVALFISFGCFLGREKIASKFLSFVSFALAGSCLVLTWSRGAWVGAVLVFLMMLLVYSHKSIPWVVLLVVGGFVAFWFLPESVVLRVESIFTFSDSSVLYRLHIWQGCSALARKCFLTGVGIGESAFAAAYDEFALTGIEAPHAHNLFFEILLELGIMGVLVFAILILMIVRSAFSLFRARSFESFSSVACLGLLSSLVVLLLQGVTDYIWYNNRMFLLFWIIMGLISAVRRVGMRSSEMSFREHDAYDITITLTKSKKQKKKT